MSRRRRLKIAIPVTAIAAVVLAIAFRAVILRETGMLCLCLEKPKQAEAFFDLSLKARADDPLALHGLGVALGLLGRPGEAARALERSVALDASDPEAHYNLGSVYMELRRYDGAVRQLEAAIQLNPSFVDALMNLALAQVKLKQFDQAVDTLRRAAKAAPDDAEVQYELGLDLFVIGKGDEARHQCDLLKGLDSGLAEKLEKLMQDSTARARLRGEGSAKTDDASPRSDGEVSTGSP